MDIWRVLLGAFALFLIAEALYPLIAPLQWRNHLRKLAELDLHTIRKIAFIVFLTGAVIWIIVFHI
ncbi:MAG: DUF2065 domain-containing protein [Legionellales bacterium]|nr:DUF2065 domain-containing protein [Legionellales bacterium]